MKKHYFRSAVATLLPLLLIAQPVEACTGFIIGKKLTADGSTLVGRTEDLEPNHNKNFVVRERVYNKKGAIFEDAANGFSISPCQRLAISIQPVPDVTPDQEFLTKQDSMNMGFPFLPLYLLQQMTRSKKWIPMSRMASQNRA